MNECPYCKSKTVVSSIFRSRFECGSVVTTVLGSERLARSTACPIIQSLKFEASMMRLKLSRYNRVVAERNAMEAQAISFRDALARSCAENEELRKNMGGLA